MPRKAPTPLFIIIDRFLDNVQSGHIMFCKRYKVRDAWEIDAGAILDLNKAEPRLIQLCRELYLEDNKWFVGDTNALIH